MNIFEARNKRKKGAIIKHSHFFQIYEAHFSHLQDEEITLLEIGVFNGGSLYMWRNYFPKAKIIGIDIDPYCKRWESIEDNIFIEIGDQVNSLFLENIAKKYGKFNIIIDDGGHENHQIISSFYNLFPHLAHMGIYVVEDTYHAYWPRYTADREKSTEFINSDGTLHGGKPLNPLKVNVDGHTSMTFLQALTNKINCAAYIKNSKESSESYGFFEDREPDIYEKNIFSIHFYDNICFIQKIERNGIDSYGKSTWYPHVCDIPEDKNYE